MALSNLITKEKAISWIRAKMAGKGGIFSLISGIILVAILVAEPANAASLSSDPLSGVLCNIISIITGGTGKALATIALIFLAVGLFVGKINWGVAIAVGIGIGGMFGATSIVKTISGDSTAICT